MSVTELIYKYNIIHQVFLPLLLYTVYVLELDLMVSDMVTMGLKNPPPFTILAQHGHTDTRVAQLDERRAALRWVTFSGQQQIFGADISMNNVLFFLQDSYMLMLTHYSGLHGSTLTKFNQPAVDFFFFVITFVRSSSNIRRFILPEN